MFKRRGLQPPTTVWTRRQLAWLAVQGIGAMIIDAAINFGVHVPMYQNRADPVTLWDFPVTIAGDLAITLIVQVILTVLIASLLQHMDLRSGLVQPLHPAAFRWWPRPGTFLNWWWQTSDYVRPPPGRSVIRLLFADLVRALLWCVATFIFFWPIAIGICAGIWGNRRYNGFPQPQLIFAVYGGLLGLALTPIIGALTLRSKGDQILRGELHAREAAAMANAATAAGVAVPAAAASGPATAAPAGMGMGAPGGAMMKGPMPGPAMESKAGPFAMPAGGPGYGVV
jgi:hypothetical protein